MSSELIKNQVAAALAHISSVDVTPSQLAYVAGLRVYSLLLAAKYQVLLRAQKERNIK
jgi:hypothetical protein